MNKLSESEKKTLFIWLMIAIIIFIVVLIIKVINPNIVKSTKNNYSVLNDYNRYYTVSATIDKYYSFINEKNYSSVLNILDDKYKKDNNIDEDTIGNYIPTNDKAIGYRSRLICYNEIDKGIVSYYVSGKEQLVNTVKVLDEKYYNVVLDGNTFLFSIKPIDKKMFEEVCHE